MTEVLSNLHFRNELLSHACGFLPFGIPTYFWCGYKTFLEGKIEVSFIIFASPSFSIELSKDCPDEPFNDSTNHQVTEYQLKVC